MWWWMHDGSVGSWGWMAVMGWVWMVVFWGAIIALVVWAVRRAAPASPSQQRDQPSPIDIAKARYAKGEITREEFEELKRTLSA